LHPKTPVNGIAIEKMFPRTMIDATHTRLRKLADELGVPFMPVSHMPNTKKALALSAFAQRRGKLTEWRTETMFAHWRDGRDIGDMEVLNDLLEKCGLDTDDADRFLESSEVIHLLHAQRVEASRWNVTGIPTWFALPDGWTPGSTWPEDGPQPVRVVGCHPYTEVEQAIQQAGATPRS